MKFRNGIWIGKDGEWNILVDIVRRSGGAYNETTLSNTNDEKKNWKRNLNTFKPISIHSITIDFEEKANTYPSINFNQVRFDFKNLVK